MSKMRKEKTRTEGDMGWELESRLEPGMLRFLAHVIENGLQTGLRSPQDFIRHFSPVDIMQGLADRPDLRANILVPATGLRQKIALKKPAEAAGLDLQIAVEEGETDATVIVSLFHPDDRVRYLDRNLLWGYIVEPKFWMRERGDGPDFEMAKSHVSFIVDRAVEDRLVTYKDIVDGITVSTLVQYIPLTDLAAVIENALANSHGGKPFTEQDLLRMLPSNSLVDHVPLSVIWDQVLYPKVAEAIGLVSGDTTTMHHRVPTGVATTAGSGLGVPEQSDAPEDDEDDRDLESMSDGISHAPLY